MISLAMLSQKGGVGKTTVALNLSLSFARRGYSTLLVDYDPQGAVGLSLGGKVLAAPGLVPFVSEGRPLDQAVLATRERNLSLLPAGKVAASELDSWAQELASGRPLLRVLQQAERRFDIVLVDTQAGLTDSAKAAALCAGRVLVPLQCEPLALRTIPFLLERIGAFRASGHAVELVGVLINMSDFRNETSMAVLEEAWSLYPELVLETHLPRDRALLRASAAGAPVALLSRRPPHVASVFDHLAAELELRLPLTHEDADETPQSLLD